MHGSGVPWLRHFRCRLLTSATRAYTTGSSERTLPSDLREQVARALREDVGAGDVTAALIPPDRSLRARVIAREPATICGTAWFDETFRQLDSMLRVDWLVADAETVNAGAPLCELTGPARALLTGERTALNFLQILSGTATETAHYVAAIAGTNCRILDTRKTLPGLRTAQKYAVLCGGGTNHRIGLFDLVLIKENHIAAAGSIAAAVQSARRLSPQLRVEVETEDLAQVSEAVAAGADIIMLDEFSHDDMRRAVQRTRASVLTVLIEASGNVSLDTVRAIAETGVDYISVGGLTKHVRAIDLSMRFA